MASLVRQTLSKLLCKAADFKETHNACFRQFCAHSTNGSNNPVISVTVKSKDQDDKDYFRELMGLERANTDSADTDLVIKDSSDSEAVPVSVKLRSQFVGDDGIIKDYRLSKSRHKRMALMENVLRDNESTDVDVSSINLKTQTQTLPSKSYNLAAYVSQSETLTNLVRLGVNLSRIEQKFPDAANMLLKLNFESDIKPYLKYFHDLGMATSQYGPMFTKNPFILEEGLENVNIRTDYFKSMKFTNEAITRIFAKAPLCLSMRVGNIDAKLGHYQRDFKLSGDEVRSVISDLPKLITWRLQVFEKNRFHLNEFLGFSKGYLKQILMNTPKVYLADYQHIEHRFDYLYNVMKISHRAMAHWPRILITPIHLIQQRHLYLESIGRAQYDPKLEQYVALPMLTRGRDPDFCSNVAKTSVQDFNDFMKTL